MKELLRKMAAAKIEIKDTKVKKEGTNTFSKTDYFTPSQIEFLVATACFTNGLMTKFDLVRNELGVYGILTIYDVDSGASLEYTMATAIPEIKATNIAQRLGGCVTYTERYLKMSAFGITDNKLDFDTTENTTKLSKETLPAPINVDLLNKAVEDMLKCSSRDEMGKIWEANKAFQKQSRFINATKTTGEKYPKA